MKLGGVSNKRLKLKKRSETLSLYIVPVRTEESIFCRYLTTRYAEGYMDSGAHFYVNIHGDISTDRHHDEIASSDWKEHETSIYCLVQVTGDNRYKISDGSQLAINRLVTSIKDHYPKIDVRMV